DDALLQVVGEPDGGDAGPERDGLGEDAGHQVFAVAGPVYLDRAAEHVGEQQHEHDRLDGGEDQQVGYPLDLRKVALGDDPPVDRGVSQRAHAFTSSVTRCPVSCRNTSSRVGRRTSMSASSISAVSSWRTASVRATTRPLTGTATRCASW